MVTDTLNHRQRVIFVGLRRMSNDRNLIIDGFRHWMTNHSSESLDIDSVVASLVGYLGLDGSQKKTLMVALHAAANKMTDDLPDVPKALLDRASANSSMAANTGIEIESNQQVRKALPPHCNVTSAYLQTLTQLLAKQDSSAFIDFKSILSDEGVDEVSSGFQKTIKNWAEDGLSGLEIPETVSEADCKNVAHQIYLLLSEVIGPMESDNLVNGAVRAANNLDDAARFQPRLLV